LIIGDALLDASVIVWVPFYAEGLGADNERFAKGVAFMNI